MTGIGEMVEAAGTAPASRRVSKEASTCLASCLISLPWLEKAPSKGASLIGLTGSAPGGSLSGESTSGYAGRDAVNWLPDPRLPSIKQQEQRPEGRSCHELRWQVMWKVFYAANLAIPRHAANSLLSAVEFYVRPQLSKTSGLFVPVEP